MTSQEAMTNHLLASCLVCSGVSGDKYGLIIETLYAGGVYRLWCMPPAFYISHMYDLRFVKVD